MTRACSQRHPAVYQQRGLTYIGYMLPYPWAHQQRSLAALGVHGHRRKEREAGQAREARQRSPDAAVGAVRAQRERLQRRQRRARIKHDLRRDVYPIP